MVLDLGTSSLNHSSMATPAPTKKSPIGSTLGSHLRLWSLTQSRKSHPPLHSLHTQLPPLVSSVSNVVYLMSPMSLPTVHYGRPAATAVTMVTIATIATIPTLYAVHLLVVKSSLPTTTMGPVEVAIGTNIVRSTVTTPPITLIVTMMPMNTTIGKLEAWTLRSSRGVMS